MKTETDSVARTWRLFRPFVVLAAFALTAWFAWDDLQRPEDRLVWLAGAPYAAGLVVLVGAILLWPYLARRREGLDVTGAWADFGLFAAFALWFGPMQFGKAVLAYGQGQAPGVALRQFGIGAAVIVAVLALYFVLRKLGDRARRS